MDELRGERVALRPLEAADAQALRAIHAMPDVARWWGSPVDEFPLGDEPEATRFTVRVDGEVVGMVQYAEEDEPEYRHAWIDVFLSPKSSGRGLGADAVATLVRHLQRDRGHHRITIDPARDNLAAIRCYEKVGFRPVGVTRLSWRDPAGTWRDSLLMELVVDPPT